MFLDCIVSALKACCLSLFLMFNPNATAEQPITPPLEEAAPPETFIMSTEYPYVPSEMQQRRGSTPEEAESQGKVTQTPYYDSEDQTLYWDTN